MIFRTLTWAGAVACGLAFSQFPEFSQQYTQRLAGAVDELGKVVARFDDDATGLGLSREEAIADLVSGGRMARARALSMQEVFERYSILSLDLRQLRDEPPAMRALRIGRMSDPEVARRAWQDFRPAMPLTADGMGFAAAGFMTGFLFLAILGAAVRGLFREVTGGRDRREDHHRT